MKQNERFLKRIATVRPYQSSIEFYTNNGKYFMKRESINEIMEVSKFEVVFFLKEVLRIHLANKKTDFETNLKNTMYGIISATACENITKSTKDPKLTFFKSYKTKDGSDFHLVELGTIFYNTEACLLVIDACVELIKEA